MGKHSQIRRRNPERTRSDIIHAAQTLFSEKGFAQTGMRDIAELANVSLALPTRYFHSKADLFEAALHDALNLKSVLAKEKAHFGKALIDAIIDPHAPITLPGMIALAIGDEEATVIARRFAKQYIVEPVAKWLGKPHGRARAYLILTISTGFVIYNRHIILDSSTRSQSMAAAWLEQTIQEIVDGSDDTLKKLLKNRKA